jgi:transcriptional regulator with PAS, ATPase and Fis domain
MIGESEPMLEVYRLIQRTAVADKPILIQGDSGTGKELVARALHEASPLADKPFVVINCAALPETLLESELFGHEKGAFTGAVSSKPGLFEVADGGTMFIDEIGELAGSLQAKLLRVLEDGSMRRIGSVKERRVRVRLLAATNRDMSEEVREGRFREDLFYRINVLTIMLPPLRERDGDIRLLVDHFAGPEWRVDDEVLRIFENYSWPGNVRQLQNAIERAKILAEDEWIRAHNLPPEIVKGAASSSVRELGANMDLDTLNKIHVEDTFKRMGGNKARTARALGIGRRTLYRLLEKYGIEAAEHSH